jgi:hypothetical protein
VDAFDAMTWPRGLAPRTPTGACRELHRCAGLRPRSWTRSPPRFATSPRSPSATRRAIMSDTMISVQDAGTRGDRPTRTGGASAAASAPGPDRQEPSGRRARP